MKYIWKTKDGVEIPVNELTRSHMENVFKYYEMRLENHEIDFLPPVYFAIKIELALRNNPALKEFKEAIFGLMEAEEKKKEERRIDDIYSLVDDTCGQG